MGNSQKSKARKASVEDLAELRKLSDVFFQDSELVMYDDRKYKSLSIYEIKSLLKDKFPYAPTNILFHREDVPLEILEFLYTKNRSTKFQWEFIDTPIERENLRLNRVHLLGFIACHPNVSLKLLLDIANHPRPEARLIATENPLMPPLLRNEIYKEIVDNHGYGDKVLLLKTLAKRDVPSSLRNQGFQALFASESLITDETGALVFPEELPIEVPRNPKSYSKEDYRDYSIRYELRNHQWKFRHVFSALAFVDSLNMKTVTRIIESGHRLSLLRLASNRNLPDEAYKQLFDHVLAMAPKLQFYPLEELAANPSSPPQRLKETVDLIMPELSFKRRGSYNSQVGVHLGANPSTPLDALLTLHSLHNIDAAERVKNGTPTAEDYETETSGTPWRIWRAVEENPTYQNWVAETPNYKELLPPIIKCTCHNL